MLTITTAISQKHDVEIINIGTAESAALINAEIPVINILNKKLNNLKLLIKFTKVLRSSNTDLVHAYDKHAYFYSRIASLLLAIPLLMTKCGGENPRYYYPYCRHFINFSVENEVFFKAKRKFRNTHFFLIPNRIKYSPAIKQE